jgi:hypothetical protein
VIKVIAQEINSVVKEVCAKGDKGKLLTVGTLKAIAKSKAKKDSIAAGNF